MNRRILQESEWIRGTERSISSVGKERMIPLFHSTILQGDCHLVEEFVNFERRTENNRSQLSHRKTEKPTDFKGCRRQNKEIRREQDNCTTRDQHFVAPYPFTLQDFYLSRIRIWLSSLNDSLIIQIQNFAWVETILDHGKRLRSPRWLQSRLRGTRTLPYAYWGGECQSGRAPALRQNAFWSRVLDCALVPILVIVTTFHTQICEYLTYQDLGWLFVRSLRDLTTRHHIIRSKEILNSDLHFSYSPRSASEKSRSDQELIKDFSLSFLPKILIFIVSGNRIIILPCFINEGSITEMREEIDRQCHSSGFRKKHSWRCRMRQCISILG